MLLSIATGGIYPILWLYKNNQVICDVTKIQTVDNNFFIWLAVCVGWTNFFNGAGMGGAMQVLGIILTVGIFVLYEIWAFKTREALQKYALNEHKIDLRMNAFYTFFMTVYYINYCINDLPEEQRKQQILRGSESKVPSSH